MVTGEFDVEILRDLIDEGYEGQELLNKFIEFREAVPAAMKEMFDDIISQNNGKTYSLEECLNDDEENDDE